METWIVVAGNNGERSVASITPTQNKKKAMVEAYAFLKEGYDWIEIFSHVEGSFGI